MPIITIHFQDNPIRIDGLPDKPTFNLNDVLSILSMDESTARTLLVPALEIQDKSKLTLAGVYKLIFSNQEKEEHIRLQMFFHFEVEPALRKYGFPSQIVPAGVSSN